MSSRWNHPTRERRFFALPMRSLLSEERTTVFRERNDNFVVVAILSPFTPSATGLVKKKAVERFFKPARPHHASLTASAIIGWKGGSLANAAWSTNCRSL